MNKTFISLLPLTLFAGIAHAQNITVTTNAPTFAPSSDTGTFSLTFPATTTPGGYSLLSATLQIFGFQSATVTVTNQSGAVRTANVTLFSLITIDTNSMDDTLVGYDTGNLTVLTTGNQTYTAFQQRNFGPSSVNIDSTATAVTNTSAYLAGGTVTGLTDNIQFVQGGGGSITTIPNLFPTVNGRIVFTFAPIAGAAAPEPGTLVFLALGGGLVLAKRRRAN